MLLLGMPAALAQSATTVTAPAGGTPAAAGNKGPSSLVLYFGTGSANLRTADNAVLDEASRLYRDGKPIVMIVAGSTDATGPAEVNLRLSQARADAVLQGLVARGIPAERFQVLAKGETDPAVPNPPNTAVPENRRVEITWR
jgi:OOP family OmpA-OmpF porin